jgi:hypothetical protein
MALHLLIHGDTIEEIKDNIDAAFNDYKKFLSEKRQFGTFGLTRIIKGKFEYEVVDIKYLSDKD